MAFQFLLLRSDYSKATELKDKMLSCKGAKTIIQIENNLKDPEFSLTQKHLKAIEIALMESSPEFSVVAQDDLVFREGFFDLVKTLVADWDRYAGNDGLITLGWNPLQTYSTYKDLEMTKTPFGTLLTDRYTLGNYAYIVCKDRIPDKVRTLMRKVPVAYVERREGHPDKYDILGEPSKAVYLEAVKALQLSAQTQAIGDILARLLNQRSHFPPFALPEIPTPEIRAFFDSAPAGEKKLYK
jgi:hypothetical protein